MSQPVHVLWSGGFDSTFRVLQLLIKGKQVQPIYAVDTPDWSKRIRETAARKAIRHQLPLNLSRRLASDLIVPMEDVLWQKERKLFSQTFGPAYSPQLPWLIATVDAIKKPTEMLLVQDDFTTRQPAQLAILHQHGIKLPLSQFTKADLYHLAEQLGFSSLLDLTWSCDADYGGTSGRPCGKCDSCKERIIPQEARDYG